MLLVYNVLDGISCQFFPFLSFTNIAKMNRQRREFK